MPKTVIALYGNPRIAEDAVRDLTAHGFRLEAIEVADLVDRSSIVSRLEDRNVPHDRAELYGEAVDHGAAVVFADTTDESAQEAAEILDNHGSIDLEQWRDSNWLDYDDELKETRTDTAGESFDVIEEEVRVGKREVPETLRVRTYVTERPVTKTVNVREERIEVTREPVDRLATPGEAEQAFQEKETVFTAVREEPVIEKRAHVVEEVHVGKTGEVREEQVTATERRRDIAVEGERETDPTKPRP